MQYVHSNIIMPHSSSQLPSLSSQRGNQALTVGRVPVARRVSAFEIQSLYVQILAVIDGYLLAWHTNCDVLSHNVTATL
jgi:hypothetical protein